MGRLWVRDALLALPDRIVAGVIVAVGAVDTFGGAGDGLVAVAPEDAGAVAAAVAASRVTVLVRP